MRKFVFVFILCFQPALWASRSPAEIYMVGLGHDVFDTLQDPSISAEEAEEELRRVLEENFAINAMGKFALGKYWRGASQPERDQFLRYFRRMILKTYASRFQTHTDETFEVTGFRHEKGGTVLVTSQLNRRSGSPMRLEWRLREDNGRFKVYDVLIDGISMSITYRSEYAAVIQKQGGKVTQLNAALRRKGY